MTKWGEFFHGDLLTLIVNLNRCSQLFVCAISHGMTILECSPHFNLNLSLLIMRPTYGIVSGERMNMRPRLLNKSAIREFGRRDMKDRREMIREYKKSIRPMGIVQVRNIRNDRVYLTASANTAATINSIRFQLKMGAFLPSASLAQDWMELGEENFVIEVLDELKAVDDPKYDYQDDLKALEAMWMEKLKPFGERGYH